MTDEQAHGDVVGMGSAENEIARLQVENAALRAERDEYKRKYELVINDSAYGECCEVRAKAEAERDALRGELIHTQERWEATEVRQNIALNKVDALTRKLAEAQNEICTASDQIPPDMDGDSLSVALIKLKDKLAASEQAVTRAQQQLETWELGSRGFP